MKAGKDKNQCFRPNFTPTMDWLLSKKPKSPVIDLPAGFPNGEWGFMGINFHPQIRMGIYGDEWGFIISSDYP